ncbi:MAG: pyridoxal-phosphate dependent enzyme [Caldilineae bacterium]|nr:MAG: pyridoxal-phosphate dependent enzyme [Caldilineae bacterium]
MPSPLAFRCVHCETDYPQPHFTGCPRCREKGVYANLYAVYPPDGRPAGQIRAAWRAADAGAGVWRFADRLPDIPPAHRLSLGEGNTPLLPLKRLGASLGLPHLWLKDESRNPTWSWKDRLMAVAVSAGRAAGATAIAGSSTGNAGASLAAYAARGGLPAYVFAVEPVPPPMRALMQSYGARLYTVPTREDRFALVQAGMAERGWYPVTNLTEPPVGSNPFGLEGYKTLAFEMALALDFALPDVVVVPTSNGDGLFGIWRGLVELRELGLCEAVPSLVAARPAQKETVAFSLGRPPEALQVRRALRETGGQTCFVPEEEIIAMQVRLAKEEGLYLEAASVVGVCAAVQLHLPPKTRVVVVGTSSGLKDPATTLRHLPPARAISPRLAAVED